MATMPSGKWLFSDSACASAAAADCAISVQAIASESMQGVYLATAPQPVSNAEFMRQLRRALRMPIGLPAASWMVRVGAPLVMRTDPELALYGRYCVPTRLLAEGFEFRYENLDGALAAIYDRSR